MTARDDGEDSWWLPSGARFATGCIDELGELVERIEVERPLLVTDPGLVASGLAERLTGLVAATGRRMPVFSQVGANPTITDVAAGARLCREGQHDTVIALGGGSALDAGKAIAFASRQDRPLVDFALDLRTPGGAAEPPAVAGLPWIAVPTTAGTGSEVSPSAVLGDPDSGRKRSIAHSGMRTCHIVLDPELTVGLPPRLTAWTGMDALVHNLEAYLSPLDDPAADELAVEGLHRAIGALGRAVVNGADLDARSDMLAASTLGALAFRKGLGAVHAIGHALTAVYSIQHGLVNAVLLPHVLELNRGVSGQRLRTLAAAAGCTPASADALLQQLLQLRQQVGIPHTLHEAGIAWDDRRLEELCTYALADANAATNPVALNADMVIRVLERAGVRGASN